MVREQALEKVQHAAHLAAEERVLDILLPPPKVNSWEEEAVPAPVQIPAARGKKSVRKKSFRNGETG